MTIKACITSMRLRTLPLSLSGIIVGMAVAVANGYSNWATMIMLALTTICLQVLSNMSNELGDTLNNTDSDDRQGIHYSLQDGAMTIAQMKRLIATFVILSCLFGSIMIYFSFGSLLNLGAIIFLVFGACAVWAAMHYTLGKNPYGYRGLGDISVFIFFGLATTFGGYFLCAHDWTHIFVWLLAAAIGCFSVAVLNVNNIRDMKSDARTRTTVAIMLGGHNARMYQTFLIVLGWLLMIAYTTATFTSWTSWIYVITFPLFFIHLRGVWTRTDSELDPMLPLLVISTFIMSLLFALGICIL